MGGALSTNEGREERVQGIGGKTRRKRPLGWGGVDWIGLAQDRDQWRLLCMR
jgi:hypothetical protein